VFTQKYQMSELFIFAEREERLLLCFAYCRDNDNSVSTRLSS
jgi:hypothetical protein